MTGLVLIRSIVLLGRERSADGDRIGCGRAGANARLFIVPYLNKRGFPETLKSSPLAIPGAGAGQARKGTHAPGHIVASGAFMGTRAHTGL